jgi:hypothetical protein
MQKYPNFLSSQECSRLTSLHHVWTPSKQKICKNRVLFQPNVRKAQCSISERRNYIYEYVDWKINLHMFIHHRLGTDQMMSLEKIDSCDRSQLFIGKMGWTAMLFLNDDDFEGGNVYFKDVKIKPEAGKLVCWQNEKNTIYNDISVLSGAKLIAIKGYNKILM